MSVHRSGAEDRFARWLNARGMRYEYEPETFTLPNGESYVPDFWLPDVGIFVEVKAGDASRLHKAWLLSWQLPDDIKLYVWSYGHTWRPMPEGWTSENLWYRCKDCQVCYPAQMFSRASCRACGANGYTRLYSVPTPYTGKREYRKKDPIRSWRPSEELKRLIADL